MSTDDLYDVNAEYYDAVSQAHWEPYRRALTAVLAPLASARETVVDLGAGTGLGTVLLAQAAPACPVLAIEPSPALRVGLMARVVSDENVRTRTTVLPTDLDGALAAGLPDRLAGVTALNMIGHLEPASRGRLWSLLSERLVADGLAVIGLQAPASPVAIPETDFGGGEVGQRRYSGSGRAEPDGPDRVTWHMRWQVFDAGGVVVDERTATSTWWTVSPSQLAHEAGTHGLVCHTGDEAQGLYVVTRASPGAPSGGA